MIDRIREWNERILDRVAPQRVVFHHVPKCGGTSVARVLRKRYLTSQATVRPEPSFRAFEAFTGRTDTERMLLDVVELRKQMMLYHLFDDKRCVSLHVPFSEVAYERFHESYKFITILREPVARFMSHYNWSANRSAAHAALPQDFDEFLRSDRARLLGAEYVDMFADLPPSADLRTPEAAERALKHLNQFDVVGCLDDLPGFADALEECLKIRLHFGHENQGSGRQNYLRFDDLSDEDQERVLSLCAPDLTIWHSIFPTTTQKH